MFEIKNLTVAYQGELILEHVSLTCQKGKITGIIGPNGAGKSTLIKGALGLIKSQSGQTFINGKPLTRVRDQVAYVEQRSAVDLTFPINVLDLVLTGTYPKLGIFKSPGPLEKQAALDALAQVDLANFKDRQIGSLSGGQLQRVFVARAIVQDAAVVILDEPFVGLDPKATFLLKKIMHECVSDGGAIFFSTHVLDVAEKLCNKIAIIKNGNVDSLYKKLEKAVEILIENYNLNK